MDCQNCNDRFLLFPDIYKFLDSVGPDSNLVIKLKPVIAKCEEKLDKY